MIHHPRLGCHVMSWSQRSAELALQVKHGFRPDVQQYSVRYTRNFRPQHARKYQSYWPCKIVMHAPYTVNLVKSFKDCDYSHKILIGLAEFLNAIGEDALGVVTHVGYRGRKDQPMDQVVTPAQAIENLSENCNFLAPFFRRNGVKLFIENTAGAASGYPAGSVFDVVSALDNISSDYVQMCLDTCHCVADGDRVEIAYKMSKPHLGLIHLNPANKDVYLGSHLDRHSFDRLRDSVHALPTSLGEIFWNCDVPCILERKDKAIIADDADFLLGLT